MHSRLKPVGGKCALMVGLEGHDVVPYREPKHSRSVDAQSLGRFRRGDACPGICCFRERTSPQLLVLTFQFADANLKPENGKRRSLSGHEQFSLTCFVK